MFNNALSMKNPNFIFFFNLQDLLGAVCATPPHLEGAPLFQIPLASLNCDGNANKHDNADVLHQLEALSKQNNLTFIREFSEAVRLDTVLLF